MNMMRKDRFTRGRLTGGLDTVDARHNDVGQGQDVSPVLQGPNRRIPVGAGPHPIAGRLRRPRQEAPERIVVFG